MAKKDRWPELLESVRHDDGLVVRPCGHWTEEKLWLWNRYLEITTSAMADSAKWQGLTYVDLFAGPGVCEVRNRNKRLPGSPVLAARAPKSFRKMILVELDADRAKACEARVKEANPRLDVSVLIGDSNELVDQVANLIPPRSLTLAFIDPDDFSWRMNTLRALASARQVDFLLLFADAIDLVRNVDTYADNPESKLFQAFGEDDWWREAWDSLDNRTSTNICKLFVDCFEAAIRRDLGYAGLRQKVIQGPKGPLYRLLYASKHELGLKFWDKISARTISGQSDLFGP